MSAILLLLWLGPRFVTPNMLGPVTLTLLFGERTYHDGCHKRTKQMAAAALTVGGRQCWVDVPFNHTDLHNIFVQLFGGDGFGGLEMYLLGPGDQAVWHAINTVYTNSSHIGCRPSPTVLWVGGPLLNILCVCLISSESWIRRWTQFFILLLVCNLPCLITPPTPQVLISVLGRPDTALHIHNRISGYPEAAGKG